MLGFVLDLGNVPLINSTQPVPIGSGGSWWEDLLNAVVLTKQADTVKAVGVAQAQNPQATVTPTLTGNTTTGTVTATQGQQAGAVVGGFADNLVKFVESNWILFALGIGAIVLYKTDSRKNPAKRLNGKGLLVRY